MFGDHKATDQAENKTCNKCQEIYAELNKHVLSDHPSLSGNNGILNNILLNILSLMTSSNGSKSPATSNIGPTSTDRFQTIPMSVISKANDKTHISHIVENHTSAQDTFVHSSMSLNRNNCVPTFSNDFSNSQSDQLSARLAFQPDLLTNLFPSSSSQKTDFQHKNDFPSIFRSNVTQGKLLPGLSGLELPFMLPTSHDLQSTTFIGSDGNLTPAGISLLFANQSKAEGSGKSDLDVADILVNRMPIPSLNKGLDTSLLQLQTLYLQQLALNQQLPLSANNTSTSFSGNITSELTNLMKPVITNREQRTPKPTAVSCKPIDNTDQNESLQQLIARHKQIAGLIEVLSTKQKRGKDSSYKPDLYTVTTPYTACQATAVESLLSNVMVSSDIDNSNRAVPISLLQVPPILRQTLIASEVVTSKNQTKEDIAGKLIITAADVSPSSLVRKTIPIVLEDQTHEGLLNLLKSQGRISEDSDVQFYRQKLDNNILIAPAASKEIIQNLIIDTKGDGEHESESNRKRRYSSVTMVPISQYDPLDPNNEPLPTRITSPTDTKVLYKCDLCNVTFSVLATLQAHEKTHSTDKTEQCSYCHLSFNDEQEYFEHLANHRGEENIFRCQMCPKMFTSKGEFNKHFTKHTQKRPYLCSHCQKAFKDPGSLTKHERIHTGEQPYVCPTCNRGFAEKSSLRKHLRVHSGERPYKCDQCDKAFSISGNLQRHMFIHTGARPFKCTQCSKAFNNPSHLRRHIKNLHSKVVTISAINVNTKYIINTGNLVVARNMSDMSDIQEDNSDGVISTSQ